MGEVRSGRPLPQSVYWRRRLVVLGVPLALVVLVVWLLAGRGSADEPTTAPTTTTTTKAAKPPTTPKPTTKPSTTQTASSSVPDCASLDVGLTADATSYPAGAHPHLTATITNTGKDACLVDAGTQNATLVITSGADQVWSSADCAASSAKSKPLLLAPGEKSTTKVTWKRVRSEPGCPKNLPDPKAGTYAATYTVADQNAAPAVFALK